MSGRRQCALFSALEECMFPLQTATAEALGVESDLFTNMTKDGELLLRAIHYPASPPEGRFWAGEHTDIDLFTILPCATAEGLQVQNKQGEWIDIKVPADAFIINAGDMLENITNGEFRSGLHRVVAKEDGYERYSIVLFIHPRSPDRLDPLPDCIARTGGVRKYANANRLELLEERLVDLGLASFPMMQDLAESGLMERLIEVGRASPGAMKKLQEAGLASDVVLQELSRLGIPN
jgi:isopenicillin N synthase-like dioxygenase